MHACFRADWISSLAGVTFLKEAVGLPGVQFTTNLHSSDVTSSYGVVTAGQYDVNSAVGDALKIGQHEKGFVANFAYAVSQHRCYEREMDGLTASVAY